VHLLEGKPRKGSVPELTRGRAMEATDDDAQHVVLLLQTFDKHSCSLPWTAGRHSGVLKALGEDARERIEVIPLSPSFCTREPVEFVCNFLRLLDATLRVLDFQHAQHAVPTSPEALRDRQTQRLTTCCQMLPKETIKDLSGGTLLAVLKTTHFLDVEILYHQALDEAMLRIAPPSSEMPSRSWRSEPPSEQQLAPSDDCIRQDAFVVDALTALLTVPVSPCQHEVWRTATGPVARSRRDRCRCATKRVEAEAAGQREGKLCERCAFGDSGPIACLSSLASWGRHGDERLLDFFLSQRVVAADLGAHTSKTLVMFDGKRGRVFPYGRRDSKPRSWLSGEFWSGLEWGPFLQSLEYLILSLARELGADCFWDKFLRSMEVGDSALTYKWRLLALLLRVVGREHRRVLAALPCACCSAPVAPGAPTLCCHCYAIHYCSHECREKHWDAEHKAQCWSLFSIDSNEGAQGSPCLSALSPSSMSPSSSTMALGPIFFARAFDLCMSAEALGLLAQGFKTRHYGCVKLMGQQLAATYQCFPQTLVRQDRLLEMLAVPPNSKVCLMLIECLSSLMQSRGRLEDWRWDSAAVRRARRVISHLTEGLVYLKQNGTGAEFERALQLCIESCFFSITVPTPHSTEDSVLQTHLLMVYRGHSEGGRPAELFTAQVMTALMLHGVLPISEQRGGALVRHHSSETTSLRHSAEGLSWEALAEQRAAGRRSYAPFCDDASIEAQSMCAKDVVQSMTRLLQLVSLAARASKFSWRALGDAKMGPNDAAPSLPVDPAAGSGDEEEQRPSHQQQQQQHTFRDAAALILEGTPLWTDKGDEPEAEVGAVERCVFGLVREYCSWYGLIDPQRETRVSERARPTVGDSIRHRPEDALWNRRPEDTWRTGVIIEDSISDDDEEEEEDNPYMRIARGRSADYPFTVRWEDGSVTKRVSIYEVKLECKARPTKQVGALPEPHLLAHFHKMLAWQFLDLLRQFPTFDFRGVLDTTSNFPGEPDWKAYGDPIVVAGAALCLARLVSPFQTEMLQRARTALSALLPPTDAPGSELVMKAATKALNILSEHEKGATWCQYCDTARGVGTLSLDLCGKHIHCCTSTCPRLVKVGNRVEGLRGTGWNCEWYPATVAAVNGDGTCTLKWDDGDPSDTVKKMMHPQEIRALPASRDAGSKANPTTSQSTTQLDRSILCCAIPCHNFEWGGCHEYSAERLSSQRPLLYAAKECHGAELCKYETKKKFDEYQQQHISRSFLLFNGCDASLCDGLFCESCTREWPQCDNCGASNLCEACIHEFWSCDVCKKKGCCYPRVLQWLSCPLEFASCFDMCRSWDEASERGDLTVCDTCYINASSGRACVRKCGRPFVSADGGVPGPGGGGAAGCVPDMVEDVLGCMWHVVHDMGGFQIVGCAACETERVRRMDTPEWQRKINHIFLPLSSTLA
jgi:hypothetical protein